MDSILSTSTSPLRGKKRKNFLWSLNQQWVSGLLQIMAEYVDANMRSAQGFKDAVYKGVAHKLKEKFGIEVTSTQCKNQIRHQRAVWAHIQELKRKSGVSWDENKNIILMGREEYMSHMQAFPKDANFLNTPIANYVELEKVCGEGHVTGEWAKSANCKTPFGTQQVNMDDDETSGYVEIGLDATQPNDWDKVEVKEELTRIMKRAMSSSSKGCAQRKKNKGSFDDRNLHEYIAMMADSVAQVVNAIHSTTKAAEERKIFAELMTELSSIEGFSEEEVDTIYDNLSMNPTMIQSFLSKPVESKARWMRKELGK